MRDTSQLDDQPQVPKIRTMSQATLEMNKFVFVAAQLPCELLGLFHQPRVLSAVLDTRLQL